MNSSFFGGVNSNPEVLYSAEKNYPELIKHRATESRSVLQTQECSPLSTRWSRPAGTRVKCEIRMLGGHSGLGKLCLPASEFLNRQL